MPAGGNSDSNPESRRVRLCSQLPCGSYGAGNPSAVVCSRESVSCGNGGIPCRIGGWIPAAMFTSSVGTFDHFICEPYA